MADIDWKSVWDTCLNSTDLFNKVVKGKTISVACPTRFSAKGAMNIEITPTFNDDSISFDILTFNDNVSIDDLNKDDLKNAPNDFTASVKSLSQWEVNNRILTNFTILSKDITPLSPDALFDTAVDTVIEFIKNKAKESADLFDIKVDELNMAIKVKRGSDNNAMKYIKMSNCIKENRKFIFKKIEYILNRNFKWRKLKSESFEDSTASFYDKNGNLMAIVSLIDDELLIDLSKNITSKISVLKSDNEIEDEVIADINNANVLLADTEIEQLKDIISNQNTTATEHNYFSKLEKRIIKLESLFIKHRINKYN